MRSKTTQKIIDSTPEEIRESVREYANEMANSAHSYTEGAETWSPEEVAKASALGNFILNGDYVEIAKAAVNNLSHRQQSFGYVAAKAYLENESLKQSLRELIEAVQEIHTNLSSDDTFLIQFLPEKESCYKPNEWLTRAKAAIDRAKSKLI